VPADGIGGGAGAGGGGGGGDARLIGLLSAVLEGCHASALGGAGGGLSVADLAHGMLALALRACSEDASATSSSEASVCEGGEEASVQLRGLVCVVNKMKDEDVEVLSLLAFTSTEVQVLTGEAPLLAPPAALAHRNNLDSRATAGRSR
jgi:hypothetical protein